MSLTRIQLERMKEARLQREIIIPLFRRMGFHEVQAHGGPNERGKDVVMWNADGLGRRVNYAVVLKAKKITGAATGNASAATVSHQIRQCFGADYLDHTTLENQRVNSVYVICSREIPETALIAIKSSIGSDLDRHVTFVDGERLWEFLEKHSPEKLVLDQLNNLGAVLDGLSPHWRTIGNTRGEFSFEPKHPGAGKEQPILQGLAPTFPNTIEGNKRREEFKQFLFEGRPVTLGSEFLPAFVIPEFLLPILGDPAAQQWEVTLTSENVPDVKLPLKVSAQSATGIATLEYIALEFTGKIVNHEILFSNRGQRLPFLVTLGVNTKTQAVALNFEINFSKHNIKLVSEALHFLDVVGNGASLTVIDISTGIQIGHQTMPQGLVVSPDKVALDLVDALLSIQQHTQTLIVWPDEPITTQEAARAFGIAELLERGMASLENKTVSLALPRSFAHKIAIDGKANAVGAITYMSEEIIDLFGSKIPLGLVSYSWDKTFVTEEDLKTFKLACETNQESDSIAIRVTMSHDCVGTATLVEMESVTKDSEIPIFRPRISK